MTEPGRILLDGDVIRYRSAVYGDWDLPVFDVRIIGEAINQPGPFADAGIIGTSVTFGNARYVIGRWHVEAASYSRR